MQLLQKHVLHEIGLPSQRKQFISSSTRLYNTPPRNTLAIITWLHIPALSISLDTSKSNDQRISSSSSRLSQPASLIFPKVKQNQRQQAKQLIDTSKCSTSEHHPSPRIKLIAGASVSQARSAKSHPNGQLSSLFSP